MTGKEEKYALLTLIVAMVGIVVGVTVPEIRRYAGLESTAGPTQPSLQSRDVQERSATPSVEASMPPTPEAVSTSATQYPICKGVKGAQKLDVKTNARVLVPIQLTCLSAEIELPLDMKVRIETPGGPDDRWEYFFWTGKRAIGCDCKGQWYGTNIGTSRFRLRAMKQDTTAAIAVAPL